MKSITLEGPVYGLFSVFLGISLLGCTVAIEAEEGADSLPQTIEESAVSARPEAAVIEVAVAPLPEIVITPESVRAAKEYTFGYWLNGWRQHEEDPSPDIFCIETGHYGFSLDVADFRKSQFGLLADDSNYVEALGHDVERLDTLSAADFKLSVTVDGEEFRAVSCKAGNEEGTKHLQYARLWESGQVVQHFDFLGLVFENEQGRQLACNGKLDVVAWPDALTFNAELTPGVLYRDGAHPGVNGSGVCVLKNPVYLPHEQAMEHKQFSLEAWAKLPREFKENNKGMLLGKNGDASSKGFFGFTLDEGIVRASINNVGGRGADQSIQQRGGSFKIDQWNHLALTFDGQKMAFYINGVSQGERRLKDPRTLGRGRLSVGGGPHKHSRVARGLYDQIVIWNRALSAEEVEVHAYDAHRMKNREGLAYSEFFKSDERLSEKKVALKNAILSMALKNGDADWAVELPLAEMWREGEVKKLTLDCDLRQETMPLESLEVRVEPDGVEPIVATFNESLNCYVAEIDKLKRSWRTGYTDIRDYDEFSITLNNPSDQRLNVPVLIYLRDVANITGLVPMLCDEKGKPTGIPVQLSKNWHYQPLGAYLRSYMLVPANTGETEYTFRIAYGFYGTLPSASHSQLSLVGYGGNGRWDQLAIGCWGETICFDMDMSCVDVAVTDVRLLMARAGLNGKKWNWTDAGWGGDWLNALNSKGQKLYPHELKTAYLAHGPCLTEVRYDGKYGREREIDFSNTVQTLRTDDYARTFFSLRYSAVKGAQLEKGWLFKMGRTGSAVTPRVAYGNKAGLLEDLKVPEQSDVGDKVVDQLTLEGEAPWWVTFPGGTPKNGRMRAVGTRALIIRSYEATFNGQAYKQPTITAPIYRIQQGGKPNLDVLFVPPKGVTKFIKGDEVKMDIEWITLPTVVDDYYGPNEAFRNILAKHPHSWEPVYREVIGNDLKVQVRGGVLKNSYPIVVAVTGSPVGVDIQGGVGAVPMRFEGLGQATGYTLYQRKGGELVALDQSVHGNDFWQSEYDAASNSWSRSYNLPLDGVAQSSWVLIRNAE